MKCFLFIGLITLLGFQSGNAQWAKMNGADNEQVWSFGMCDSILYAGTNGEGIFRSIDQGKNWSQCIPLPLERIISFTSVRGAIFAGGRDGVRRSTDQGLTWVLVNNGFIDPWIYSLGSIDTVLFSSTKNGLYRSMNNGDTWILMTSDLSYVKSLVSVGETIFAGGNDIFKSIDEGNHWIQVDSLFGDIQTLALGKKGMFALTQMGTYRSLDNGYTWQNVNKTHTRSIAILPNETIVSDVFFSSDNGDTWNRNDSGVMDYPITFRVFGEYLFAGATGIWRRPFSEFMNVESKDMPASTPMLRQNYPNPFSSTTTIDFVLPTQSNVSLSVIDPLGNTILLQNSALFEPGYHSIVWDGSTYPNGVYYCRVVINGIVEIKKMMIVN